MHESLCMFFQHCLWPIDGKAGSWQRRADLQSGRRWETPDWVQAPRLWGEQVAAGLLLRARLNWALRCRGISGNEADVSPGCSAYCLAISRYKKRGRLLQCRAPVPNTWETCHSQGHLHHTSYRLWDLQNKQGKKPKGQTFVLLLRLWELTAGKNP